MQQFGTLMLALVFAWSGEALASIPSSLPASAAAVSAGDGDTMVAKRKKKRKKKRRKKRKKKAKAPAAAPAPAPAPEPAADKTPAPKEATGDSAATSASDSATTNWGSSDWASPDWASGGTSTSTSKSADLLKDDKSGASASASAAPAEEVRTEVTPKTRYEKSKGVPGAWVIVTPAYSHIKRRFKFGPAGETSPNLRPYKARWGVPMAGADLELYPGVLLEIPYLDVIGVRAGYRMALALESSPAGDDSTKYTTNWNEIDIDLTGRFTFGDAMLVLSAGLGMLNFELDVPASDPLSDQVQNLAYTFVRTGLDFRYSFGDLSVLLGGGFRYVLGTGELGDIFPTSSAIGFDGNVGVSYELFDFTEIFVIGQYARFLHTLEANATYVAENASDMYLGGRAGVSVFF